MENFLLGADISVWWILAQVFGVITIIFDFIVYQIKDQRKYLLVYSIGSFFWTMMFVFTGLSLPEFNPMVPVIIAAGFGVLRCMVFWWIFAKKTKARQIGGRVFLYVALAIALVAAVLSIREVDPSVQWVPIAGMFTALLFIVGQYLPSKHYLRAFAFLYAIAILVTQTPLYLIDEGARWNPMGIVIELAKIVSIIVFYCIMIRNHFYSKEIKKMKMLVDSEIGKTRDGTPIDQRMPEDRLSRLIAKLLRYELAVIDKQNMLDLKSSLSETKEIMDDLQMVTVYCNESEKAENG